MFSHNPTGLASVCGSEPGCRTNRAQWTPPEGAASPPAGGSNTSFHSLWLAGLGGLQGDATHPDPSLMTGHGGHEGPAVGVWVVHLQWIEVGLSIVSTHSIETTWRGHQRHPAATCVHRHQEAPLPRRRAKHLHPAQEARPVVTPCHVHVTAQRRCPVTATLVQHRWRRVPPVGVMVVVLHLGGGGQTNKH